MLLFLAVLIIMAYELQKLRTSRLSPLLILDGLGFGFFLFCMVEIGRDFEKSSELLWL